MEMDITTEIYILEYPASSLQEQTKMHFILN